MTDCPYPNCGGALVDYTGPVGPRPSDQTVAQCGTCSKFAVTRRGRVFPIADPTNPDTPAVSRAAPGI